MPSRILEIRSLTLLLPIASLSQIKVKPSKNILKTNLTYQYQNPTKESLILDTKKSKARQKVWIKMRK